MRERNRPLFPRNLFSFFKTFCIFIKKQSMKEMENEYKQEQEQEVEVPMMTGYLDWSGVTEEEAVQYERRREI